VDVGVLEPSEQIPGKGQDRGKRARCSCDRLAQSLSLDPVSHPICQIPDYTGVVHVADRRVIELAECLGFVKKPASARITGV
jgi:hypothetical protein